MLLRVSPFFTLWYVAACLTETFCDPGLTVLDEPTPFSDFDGGSSPLLANVLLVPDKGLYINKLRPTVTVLPRRWFHFRNLSTGTWKSSAIEPTVSPLRTLYRVALRE